MKLVQYDIILEKLKKEDIELVRYWRNNPKIQNKMQFREYISSEMQEAWFNKISNPAQHMYMLVYYKNKKIGLTNRNTLNGHTESGLFIWDDDYWNSPLPILIFLIATEVYFKLERGEDIYGKILRNNKNAISFNKSLGFKLCDGQQENENQLYRLKKEDYIYNSMKLKKYISIYYNHSEPIQIIFEKEDYNDGTFDFFYTQFSKNKTENDNFIITVC